MNLPAPESERNGSTSRRNSESPQFFEPVVQCDQVSRPLGSEDLGIVDSDCLRTRAAFAGIPPARVFDEDLTHGVGRDGEEVRAPFILGLIHPSPAVR